MTPPFHCFGESGEKDTAHHVRKIYFSRLSRLLVIASPFPPPLFHVGLFCGIRRLLVPCSIALLINWLKTLSYEKPLLVAMRAGTNQSGMVPEMGLTSSMNGRPAPRPFGQVYYSSDLRHSTRKLSMPQGLVGKRCEFVALPDWRKRQSTASWCPLGHS